jgi:hypothetical protein
MTTLSDYRKKSIKVSDKITGFTGIVTGHADYITGCDQYLIQPPCKDGEWKDCKWFDENRLIIIEECSPVLVDSNENGADAPAPVK